MATPSARTPQRAAQPSRQSKPLVLEKEPPGGEAVPDTKQKNRPVIPGLQYLFEDGTKDKEKATPKKKRATRKRPKVDYELLASPNGIEKLLKMFEGFPISEGPNCELDNVRRLLDVIEMWQQQLLPAFTFDDFIERTEELGKTRNIKEMMRSLRAGEGVPPLTQLTSSRGNTNTETANQQTTTTTSEMVDQAEDPDYVDQNVEFSIQQGGGGELPQTRQYQSHRSVAPEADFDLDALLHAEMSKRKQVEQEEEKENRQRQRNVTPPASPKEKTKTKTKTQTKTTTEEVVEESSSISNTSSAPATKKKRIAKRRRHQHRPVTRLHKEAADEAS